MTRAPSYLFIVGAPKSGTTSIAARLGTSEHIALSRQKESRYFTDFGDIHWAGPRGEGHSRSIARTWADYDALFAHKPDTAWRLDASTDYLSCEASPKLIAAFAKDHSVKVVAILRDPVARIVSEFQHTLRDQMQTGSLAQSIAAETERTTQNWHPLFHHIKRSSYAGQIAQYRDAVGDDLLVLDYHELGKGNECLNAITDFVGIPNVVETQTPERLNRSFAPRNALLSAALKSKKLRAALRFIVPKPLRPLIWNTAYKANQTQYHPTAAELTQLRELLASEVTACEADPLIPTEHWHLARGETPT
ncbi:MAG: sulfotransferase domain-containing protein [Aliishimia sp.]